MSVSSKKAARHPGARAVLSNYCPTIPGGALAACGSPYASMLRFFAQFFVESEAKLNVLRMHVYTPE